MVFEKPHITDAELACACCTFPYSVDPHFLGAGVFTNTEKVIKRNGDEVSGGGYRVGGGELAIFLDVVAEADGDGKLWDGRVIVAAESLQATLDRGKELSRCFVGGTLFSTQFKGRGDGCQGVIN